VCKTEQIGQNRDESRSAHHTRRSTPKFSHAAALVADAYTLFLLGPFYFDRPGVVLAPNGEAIVDKAVRDQVLAVLRPGFGMAKEDRVILFIDRATKQLRRVRMTLSGLNASYLAVTEFKGRAARPAAALPAP